MQEARQAQRNTSTKQRKEKLQQKKRKRNERTEIIRLHADIHFKGTGEGGKRRTKWANRRIHGDQNYHLPEYETYIATRRMEILVEENARSTPVTEQEYMNGT